MSATSHPVYNAYCGDCADGAGPFDGEEQADRWAEQHNAQYHPDPELVNDVVEMIKPFADDQRVSEYQLTSLVREVIERVNQQNA